MKERDNRDRRGPPTGSRTGPRARAAQERGYGDPFQRAERPGREGPPRERLGAPASAAIRLDPDVARVFRDAESVNEALRAVIRLARMAGGRPSGPPRTGGGSATRSGGPSGPPRDRPPFRGRDSAPPPRRRDRDERPSGPRKPRFDPD